MRDKKKMTSHVQHHRLVIVFTKILILNTADMMSGFNLK